jgi:predicted nucleotidyltransferase
MQDQNLVRAILTALDTQPGVRLAILFGSLAAGRERASSDLDLAVDAGHRLTASEKMALMTELVERTGRPVDLVDLHAVGEPLLGQILRHGKKLLGGGTCYADLIRRHRSHASLILCARPFYSIRTIGPALS